MRRIVIKAFFSAKARVLQNNAVLAAILMVCLLVNVGCSSGKPGPEDNDRQTRAILGVISQFYGEYLSSHRGKPPKDNEAFYEYLGTRSDALKLFNVESPDQLYRSHRDGRPLVIVSEKLIAPPDAPESPWAAFEQQGLDGKILAVRVRGGIHELSVDESSQLFSIE